MEDKDYKVFLHFLKKYLSPPTTEITLANSSLTGVTPVRPRIIKSLYGVVNLLAFCLMPNHFHLLVKQMTKDGITQLMNRISTNYGMYFNKKYQRVGPLFQGVYKAVLIDNDDQLLHLSRYVHLNPVQEPTERAHPLQNILLNSCSSYGDYLGQRKTIWVHPAEILGFFKTAQRTSLRDIFSYQSFVEDYEEEYDLTGVGLDLEG